MVEIKGLECKRSLSLGTWDLSIYVAETLALIVALIENMWNERRAKDTGGCGMISDGSKSGLMRPLISAKAGGSSSDEENPGAGTLKNVGTIH